MFHRVKSEVPSSEEKKQEVQPSKVAALQEKVQEHKQAYKVVSAPIDIKPTQVVDIDADIEIADEVEISEPLSQEISQSSVTEQTPIQTPTPKKEANEMNQKVDNTNNNADAARTNEAAAGFHRTGTAQVSASTSYPGAYPAYSAPATRDVASAGDRRLTIGYGITMSGEIESCDYLLVEGTVEAALKGASVLDIAESGVFYGTVEIEDATIAGRFEGDITATGRLTLREGASVTGSIAYKELEIEAGAIIDGKLTPLQAKQAAAAPVKKEAPAKAKAEAAPAEAAAPAKPANTDGELFSKAATAAE